MMNKELSQQFIDSMQKLGKMIVDITEKQIMEKIAKANCASVDYIADLYYSGVTNYGHERTQKELRNLADKTASTQYTIGVQHKLECLLFGQNVNRIIDIYANDSH